MSKQPKGELIHINKIKVPKGRAREDFSAVHDLMKSIQERGLINPICVTPSAENPEEYEVLAGETRFRAFMMAGVGAEIPCTIRRDLSDLERKCIELEENVKRKNLAWQEEVKLLEEIHRLRSEESGATGQVWTQDDTAEATGQSRPNVTWKIKLAQKMKDRPDLAEQVKDLPAQPALRRIEQLEEAEKAERIRERRKKKQAEAAEQTTENGNESPVPVAEPDFQLACSDAVDFLKALPDESVDLVIMDPPFGLEAIEEMRVSRRGRGSHKSYTGRLADSDNLSGEEVEALLANVLPELGRVLKPQSHFYVFFDFSGLTMLADLLPPELTPAWPVLIWDKGRTTTSFNGYNFPPRSEAILFGHKPGPDGKRRRLEKTANQILSYAPVHSKSKVHAFQKPEALLMFLVQQSSYPDQLVLDPFAGSGATLAAALKSGRRALGCEVNETNHKVAMAYLESQSK